MTTRTHFVETLHKHFIGKKFTSKDVAARSGASHSWAGKVLNTMEHVEIVEERDIITARGVVLSRSKEKVYVFDPPRKRSPQPKAKTFRKAIEVELRLNFVDKTFTSSEIAKRTGATARYTRDVLLEIRGVRIVGAKKVNGSCFANVFTFKPVSNEKWVD